ncbi:hypothetical protein ACQKDB_09415 [Planococcus kocurii]|uniref:hypothetical protein n=1 Tax=Planococcus kocurii TaxID=1374 RepID=UPI003D017436
MTKKMIMVFIVALFLAACSDTAPPNETVIAGHEEWASLPEYSTIIEEIEDGDYKFETVSDNQEKRILLLSDKEGVEQYKSIFIKNTDRLILTDIDDGGEIFNAVLKQ